MVIHRLAISYLVPSQNARDSWHWSKRDRDTKSCERSVRFLGASIPRAHGPRIVRVIAYRPQRCADHANIVGGSKGLLDALVRSGLLKDDRDQMATITYDQFPLSCITPGDLARFGRVPITVVELSDKE